MCLKRFFLNDPVIQNLDSEMRRYSCAFTGHRPEKVTGAEAKIVVELRKEIELAIFDGYMSSKKDLSHTNSYIT